MPRTSSMTRTASRFRRIVTPAMLAAFTAVSAAALCTWSVREASAGTSRAVALDDSADLWLVSEPSIPLISIRFAVPGGAIGDPKGKEGVSSLMTALLMEGAGDLDSQAFARALSDRGTRLTLSAGRDRVFGSLDTISRNASHAIDLLRLALERPRFDPDAFERLKQQRLADLELAAKEPRKIVLDRWFAETFPAQTYGRPVDGTPGSIRAVTLEDVKARHRALLESSGLKIVVVGDMDEAAAKELLRPAFAAWKTPRRNAPRQPLQSHVAGAPIFLAQSFPLATASFGLPTVAPDHADYPALQVLSQIIGSGDFDSTLMEEIRVKRGLAYNVSTSLMSDGTASVLLGGLATRGETMRDALATLRTVLGEIAADGPRADRFEAAKDYLIGTGVLDHDGNARRAQTILRHWLQGREPSRADAAADAIDRVTLADVRRVAAQALDWRRMNIVVVGATGEVK